MTGFEDKIRIARRADLGEFLVTYHPDAVKVTGHCVYLREHDSVYTSFGYCGYTRFSSTETGNSVDFLVRYLKYSFVDAVNILVEFGHTLPVGEPPGGHNGSGSCILPDQNADCRRVFAYLTKQRAIPPAMVNRLLQEKLLYQEAKTGNAVFVSRDRRFCELRGTNTFSLKPFHGIRREYPACFWSVRNTAKKVETAYICESAIDAVSLLVLHENAEFHEPSAYVSIGGVRNQQTIDRINASVHAILAVDNDPAGQECRERNPAIESIEPILKDWNEDLQFLARVQPENQYLHS